MMATKFLKDFDFGASPIVEDSEIVNSLCNGLSHLFFITLGKIESPIVKKIIISLVPNDFELELNSEGAMPEVFVPFNSSHFKSLNSLDEKLLILLNYLRIGINYLLSKVNLDKVRFDEALKEIEDSDFSFLFYHGKEVWDQGKTSSAILFYEFDLKGKVNIGIEVNGKITVKKIGWVVLADWMFISPYMGRISWLADNLIVLECKSKETSIRFKLD